MKKIRSLNVNKKYLAIGAVIAVGLYGASFLDKKLNKFYSNRKNNLEESIGNYLNKKIVLGDYTGLWGFGFGISNSKIIESESIDSKIVAEKVYVGFMPIRSLLNKRWILDIQPKQTTININKDFFKRKKSQEKEKNLNRERIKYDLSFHIKEFSNFRIQDLDLENKFKGKFRYDSKRNEIKGYTTSLFDKKDNLRLKFNKNLNDNSFGFQVLSKGINFNNFRLNAFDRNIALEKGKLESNLKFYRSSTDSYCKGGFSLNKLKIKSENLDEKIFSENISLLCEKNKLLVKTNNLNYGSLISDFNFDIPLNKQINDIALDGLIRYQANPNSNIKLSGKIPYWFDKKGKIYLGKLNSSFDLTSTELANLNVFRKNGIEGTITAKGEFKGDIFNPDLNINFVIYKPYYKGIRFRETWEGEINNSNNDYQINIKSKSPIPSFLTLNFDSKIKLKNLSLIRLFSANKGTLNIVRNKDIFKWEAINLPLDELEFSTNNSKFDRISGTVNGSGKLSADLSYSVGQLGWSFGKFRNLDLKTSYFDFKIKNKEFFVDSFIIPDDGGIIKILYDSKNTNLLEVDFDNVSSKWFVLNAINTFKIDDKNIEAKGKAEALNFVGIENKDKNYIDQIMFINKYYENKKTLESNLGIEKYFRKFDSRYSGDLLIAKDKEDNYRILTNIKGFLDLKINDVPQNKKEYFDLTLNGGLFKGKGKLIINQIPLKSLNIFLENQKEFKGDIDLELNYDLDKQYFETKLVSENTFIKDYEINFDKSSIIFNKNKKNRFHLDLALLSKDKTNPIKLNGFVPINKKGILDLELKGRNEFIELIDLIFDENINFNKGNVSLYLRMRGPVNMPIFAADLKINESEIEILNNKLKKINGKIEIRGDKVRIQNFSAFGEKKGAILLRGILPVYEDNISNGNSVTLIANEFNLVSKNKNLILDSVIDISGSFVKPTLSGNIALSNGFVNIKNAKKNDKNNESIKRNITKKNNWEELFWKQNKDIEIITNEEEKRLSQILVANLKPEYLFNLNFNDLKLKFGPNFRFRYSNIITAYLETKPFLEFNESFRDENDDEVVDLKIRGLIEIKNGRANLATTPFKLEKNNNTILFAERLGINPIANFNLTAKVPDSIMPISQNNQDGNISDGLNNNPNSFGTIGIGNSRLIKIDASYYGLITKLSINDEFDDYWFERIQLRSTPSYSKSEIIALIGANPGNLINRSFVSQLNSSNFFSERFQLTLYPALIENNKQLNNVFSNEDLDKNNSQGSSSSNVSSSQSWVAELGLDITDRVNFAVQAIPDRNDLPPVGIFTLQANPNLDLRGSFDSNGDWKSQLQLYWRY